MQSLKIWAKYTNIMVAIRDYFKGTSGYLPELSILDIGAGKPEETNAIEETLLERNIQRIFYHRLDMLEEDNAPTRTLDSERIRVLLRRIQSRSGSYDLQYRLGPAEREIVNRISG